MDIIGFVAEITKNDAILKGIKQKNDIKSVVILKGIKLKNVIKNIENIICLKNSDKLA